MYVRTVATTIDLAYPDAVVTKSSIDVLCCLDSSTKNIR